MIARDGVLEHIGMARSPFIPRYGERRDAEAIFMWREAELFGYLRLKQKHRNPDWGAAMNSLDSTPENLLPLPSDPLIRFFQEIGRVKNDQRLLLLVSHGVLELLVNSLIDLKCKNAKRITSDSRGFPHAARLLILNEIGVISDFQLKVYDSFRRLRNRAAHEPLFVIKAADLAAFYERFRDPASLYLLCTALVGGLWNDHVTDLASRFLPSMADAIAAGPRATRVCECARHHPPT
jgi:hypothetical protein